MSAIKYVNKIWQNMARKQLENELNFFTTDDNERIKLPIDDSIDYLKIFNDTHKTYEEELEERIDKAIEYIEDNNNYEEGYCDGELMIYKRNLKDLLDILRGENNE